MKKLMLILLATAAMLLVGCSKDKVADSMGYSYSVSVGDWTRPVIDGVSVVPSKNYEMKVGDVRLTCKLPCLYNIKI